MFIKSKKAFYTLSLLIILLMSLFLFLKTKSSSHKINLLLVKNNAMFYVKNDFELMSYEMSGYVYKGIDE
jgi:hypothetical protein